MKQILLSRIMLEESGAFKILEIWINCSLKHLHKFALLLANSPTAPAWPDMA
jgi:hypothetical protein